MSHNILIYDRPAQGTAFRGNITRLVPDWRRTTRAVGGYWSGSGTITGLTDTEMEEAFLTWIGRRLVERTCGMVSWEGYIHQLDLVSGGFNYRISLDPEWFHNKVRVLYRKPAALDTDQGNLDYSFDFTGDAHVTLVDDAQDFSPWETTSGDAKFKVEIVNDDGSRSWAYLGAKISNTEIKICEDVELTDDGQNGEERSEYSITAVDTGSDWVKVQDDDNQVTTDLSVGDTVFIKDSTGNDGEYTVNALSHSSGETQITVDEDITDATVDGDVEYWTFAPSSYNIVPAPESDEDPAEREETAWATNSDSVDQFYTREYIIVEGEMPDWKAENLRDLHLAEYRWPRSRMVGGPTIQARRVKHKQPSLSFVALGYWHTLDWLHATSDLSNHATNIIQAALTASEFLSAGRIEDNRQPQTYKCADIPMGWGEIVEQVIEAGDMDENLWKGGVYADREFVFEQAPTTVEYYIRNNRLVDKGGVPVIPSLLEPGFLLRNASAPVGYQPPGSDNVWDDPQVAYVEAVTFEAPDRLILEFYGEEESVVMLKQDIDWQQEMGLGESRWQ